MSCSTSAGPGLRGERGRLRNEGDEGAIDSSEIDDQLSIDYTAIGSAGPRGICGSGLIDLVADLFLQGVIDKRGRLQPVDPRVREMDGRREFVIVPAGEVEKARRRSGRGRTGLRDITINDDDIGNIIRTKGAIYAGCSTLLKSVDLGFQDLSKIYVAGGFGNYLNLHNAITIGLLPDLPLDRFAFLGNAALGGATLCLLSQDQRKEALEVYHRLTYLDLSTMQLFFDQFSSALFLPHTNMEDFPTVRGELSRESSERRVS